MPLMTTRLRALATAGVLLAATAVVLAQQSPAQAPTRPASSADRLVGFAHDAATQRFLYTEVHSFQRGVDGQVQTALTRYFDPQGREMARKTLDYRAHRWLPVFRLDVPAWKYAEGLLGQQGQITLFKQDQGREQKATLERGNSLEAADSGFNHLLQDQWSALMRGNTVSFGLVVAGQLDRYRFRARRVGDVSIDGIGGVQLRIEPDSLLRLLVDPIDIVYDRQGERLLRYTGVSNILDPQTGQVFRKVTLRYSGPPPPEAKWPDRVAATP